MTDEHFAAQAALRHRVAKTLLALENGEAINVPEFAEDVRYLANQPTLATPTAAPSPADVVAMCADFCQARADSVVASNTNRGRVSSVISFAAGLLEDCGQAMRALSPETIPNRVPAATELPAEPDAPIAKAGPAERRLSKLLANRDYALTDAYMSGWHLMIGFKTEKECIALCDALPAAVPKKRGK